MSLRFSDGISFDFSSSDVRALVPGASVLIVGNRKAFNMRYGHSYDAAIGGEFSGNLKNGGERIQLDFAGIRNTPVHGIDYEDSLPWSRAADGFGASLLLRDPTGLPDHALASSWTSSAHPGGHPGGDPVPLTYEKWRSLAFSSSQSTRDEISGPLADPDGDGVSNFAEYALGGSARLADSEQLRPRVSIVRDGGKTYLCH